MELQEKLLKEIVPFNNPLIVEIGAADGEGTRKLLDLFGEAKIYSFDADPRAIECHKDFVKDDRCTLINKAVSNEEGTMEFYLSNKTSQFDAKLQRENRKEIYEKATKTLTEVLPEYTPSTTTHGGWFYSSTILENQYNGARGLNWNSKVEVDVTTLDKWCDDTDLNHIDLLWTDVEGAERRMLEGAKNSLRFTNYVLLEYGLTDMFPEAMSRADTIECMKNYGFSLYADYSDIDLLFKRDDIV
jgi:FkbM family methyltransferase